MSPRWRLLFLIASISIGVSTDADISSDKAEVLALYAFRQSVTDPNNDLQTWDSDLLSPCTWFHVTCNSEQSVIRVSLAGAGLSGRLVPNLGVLSKLQYLELNSNNISGPIPQELGNLTSLVSMNLHRNNLSGTIPDSLGQLSSLRFLRLNNNSLSGSIPFSLTAIPGLQVVDVSNNDLSGEVPSNGSFSALTSISFTGNDNLCGAVLGKQCPGEPPISLPPGAPSFVSPPDQGSKNWKVIILATAISAAVLIFLIVGLTFMVCRNQQDSQDLHKSLEKSLQKRTKLAVESPKI